MKGKSTLKQDPVIGTSREDLKQQVLTRLMNKTERDEHDGRKIVSWADEREVEEQPMPNDGGS